MITDTLLLFGFAVALVLLILVGCKVMIDFPGLLDGNIVHVLKEINADEESFKQATYPKNYKNETCRSDQDMQQLCPKQCSPIALYPWQTLKNGIEESGEGEGSSCLKILQLNRHGTSPTETVNKITEL